MKILVYANAFEVGGTQTNAIELCASLRDTYGHDIVIFAVPGRMVNVAERSGLRFISAPDRASKPSGANMRALREVVRRERPDLIQAWEWVQCVEAFYAAHLLQGIPMMAIDMRSDDIQRVLPKTLVTTFGTPEFVDRARAAGRKRVGLLLPPVDVQGNAPGVVDPKPFCLQYKVRGSEITLVTVSRLAATLKGDSLRRTIDAVRALGREVPLRFILVGDGALRSELERLAAEANRELGREAVTLTGELLDPRPAYAIADVVVGMGGSALRGMAFCKPAIIVGEQGFSSVLTPKTAEFFYYHGIFGIGDGKPSNEALIKDVRTLVGSREKLPALGAFSRRFVVEHFALEKIGMQLERFSRAAAAERRRPLGAAADGLRTVGLLKLRGIVPQGVRRHVKSTEERKAFSLKGRSDSDAIHSDLRGA